MTDVKLEDAEIAAVDMTDLAFLLAADPLWHPAIAGRCERAAALLRKIPDLQAQLDQRWKPIDTCPENTRVLFGWLGEDMTEHGRMERNVRRLSGDNKHHFWGYNSCNDDYPPTHWQPAIEGPK
jgi:hypothetical protein